jgi:RimJ/RimL family protein N-acetyltransferase
MITTDRLILRTWKEKDGAPFAELNADPAVREFFTTVLTREQSDAEMQYFRHTYERDGFGLFAAELIVSGEFTGFIGIQKMALAVPSVAQPAVEIGWRLARRFWGKGLATEGAQAAMRYGFETLRLREIVAITVPANVRSRRVMDKIGLKHYPELDFDHPRIAENHPLRRHVLYARRNDPPIAGR